MRARLLISLISAVFLTSACFAEPLAEAADLRFQSFFARTPDGRVVYTLLGTGFFRSMRTDDADKVVAAWVSAHPHARIVPVSELPTGTSNIQLIYGWLADGSDNLNVELVRRGTVPASTMIDPAQRLEASSENSLVRKAAASRPRRLVPDAMYRAFTEKIAAAQAEAKRGKKGIWADRFQETRELERVH